MAVIFGCAVLRIGIVRNVGSEAKSLTVLFFSERARDYQLNDYSFLLAPQFGQKTAVCGIRDLQYGQGIKTTSLITVSFSLTTVSFTGATGVSGGATSAKSVPLHIGQRSALI
jgi:hypothetical protein